LCAAPYSVCCSDFEKTYFKKRT